MFFPKRLGDYLTPTPSESKALGDEFILVPFFSHKI
jgi:hypothetical protein